MTGTSMARSHTCKSRGFYSGISSMSFPSGILVCCTLHNLWTVRHTRNCPVASHRCPSLQVCSCAAGFTTCGPCRTMLHGPQVGESAAHNHIGSSRHSGEATGKAASVTPRCSNLQDSDVCSRWRRLTPSGAGSTGGLKRRHHKQTSGSCRLLNIMSDPVALPDAVKLNDVRNTQSGKT